MIDLNISLPFFSLTNKEIIANIYENTRSSSLQLCMFLRNASNICTTLRHTCVSNKMLEEKPLE